jgi:hypothetical protein
VQEAELRYRKDLAAAQANEASFGELRDSGFVTLPCQDLAGNQVVMVMPQKLPKGAQAPDAERVYSLVISQLDTEVNKPYVVVYVHTFIAEQQASVSVLQLRGMYERCVL